MNEELIKKLDEELSKITLNTNEEIHIIMNKNTFYSLKPYIKIMQIQEWDDFFDEYNYIRYIYKDYTVIIAPILYHLANNEFEIKILK